MNDTDQTQIEVLQSEDYQQLFLFEKAQTALKRMTSAHETGPVREAEANRRYRRVDVDVEALRKNNLLDEDATMIPIRVIDTNIKREQPSLIAFFTQSFRSAIFKPRNSNINPANLEKAFTDGMRYTGWELPFYKCIDGAQLHGRDAIELEYDDTKPFKIAFAHIGYENLIFQANVPFLEDCERVIVRYAGQTAYSLRKKVQKFGFSSEQVENNIIKDSERVSTDDKTYIIYKVYFKYQDIVYVAWFSDDCDDWLKAPEPLWMGRTTMQMELQQQPQALTTGEVVIVDVQVPVSTKVYESMFPIKLYIYKLSEDKAIHKGYGRAFEDYYRQVAQTALWSSFVNGTVRASNIYGSPEQDTITGASLAQLDVQLSPNRLYNKKVNFWNVPYPPIAVIDAAQRLDNQIQQETGQVNYAVMNRKDTEKTATEINSAKEESNLLSTVQVTLLASFFRNVFSHAWLIVQSLALSNTIQLPSVSQEELTELYEVDTSGTVDVLEREQTLNKRLQMWGIISQTPLAGAFLIDIIKNIFPQDAARYEQILTTGGAKNKAIQDSMRVIESLIMDDSGQIKQEYAPFMEQLTQLAEQSAQAQQSVA